MHSSRYGKVCIIIIIVVVINIIYQLGPVGIPPLKVFHFLPLHPAPSLWAVCVTIKRDSYAWYIS